LLHADASRQFGLRPALGLARGGQIGGGGEEAHSVQRHEFGFRVEGDGQAVGLVERVAQRAAVVGSEDREGRSAVGAGENLVRVLVGLDDEVVEVDGGARLRSFPASRGFGCAGRGLEDHRSTCKSSGPAHSSLTLCPSQFILKSGDFPLKPIPLPF